MAQRFIEETTLTNIADAIRAKEGTTAKIDPADYATRIGAIDTQEDLDPELSEQDTLISEIMTALDGKTSGKKTVSVTISSPINVRYISETGIFSSVANGTIEALGGFVELGSTVYNKSVTGDFKEATDGNRFLYIFLSDGGTLTVTSSNEQ